MRLHHAPSQPANPTHGRPQPRVASTKEARNVTTVPDLTPSRQPPSRTLHPLRPTPWPALTSSRGGCAPPLGGERKAGWRHRGTTAGGGNGGWQHHGGCTLTTLRQRMTAWRAGLGVWLAGYRTTSHPLQLATVNLLLTPHSLSSRRVFYLVSYALC